MINKNDYLNAKEIVRQFEKEQSENKGYAVISCEGDFVAKIEESEIIKWLDNFFSKKLKNKPKKYSQKLWDELKNYDITLDSGESYILPYFSDELCEKWF